jgi:hypothetical protein
MASGALSPVRIYRRGNERWMVGYSRIEEVSVSQDSADAFALRIKQEKEFREIFDKIKDDKELYYKRIKEEGYDFTVEEYRKALRTIMRRG